ncbi:helix-hairpin-helix domain-containing protein [Carboxylicivirga sp. RSCT41]|uniref:helix-hairpin-helix domain-containing protein n=1 Tax=Carboxylicivirga agarovorans TaxID=3417570 RepID=UPI003D328C66
MWRDLFTLSKREQQGLISLMVILIVTGAMLFVGKSYEEPEVDEKLIEWANSVRIIEDAHMEMVMDTVFAFNPNYESVSRLQLLGFSNLAIVNLIKYREAGGFIKSPDKLRQIFGVDSVLYNKLQDYIDLELDLGEEEFKNGAVSAGGGRVISRTGNSVARDSVVTKPEMRIEINSADTAVFALLKGIGPVLSKRIVAYRKKLGGYCEVQQLIEVYGISDDVLGRNLPYLEVDESLIQPLDVSRASLRQMKNHPYLDFYMALEIYEARKNNNLISLDQFYNSDAFMKADTAMLSRYFVVGKEGSGGN